MTVNVSPRAPQHTTSYAYAQDIPLLSTKLYVPPIRPELVSRPRLIERLNAGLRSGRKLTLLSAPAGFGKTTLLSAWINQSPIPNTLPLRSGDDSTQSPKFAWLSLDENDNDLARFLAYLIAAFQMIEENIGEDVLGELQMPGFAKAKTPHSVETLLTSLINQLSALPDNLSTDSGRGLILVLDDYHLITTQAVHDALAFTLDHLPPNAHLVIASRSDPPLPLARLRGRGQLTELRLADLRFTPDEITAFLDQVVGLELSVDDVAILTSRTEGWIAGLQMAALALQATISSPGEEPGRVASFIHGFSASDRYVLDYLMQEVLNRQPKTIQTFLLQTSILNRLTAPLCDAVVEDIRDWVLDISDRTQYPISSTQYPISNTQYLLEHLESSNLFIVPLDNERRWYRYHRLFADLLRKRLHLREQPERVSALHLRASEWYEANGLTSLAIDHALSAKDFERAARLIEGAAEATLMRSEVSTLLSWTEALPDDVLRARPRLCVFHAGVLLLSGGPLEAVESRLQDAEEGDATGQVAGEMAAFRAMIATFQGDAQRSAKLSRRALELLPEESPFLRGIVADNLGIAHTMSGDVEAAIRAFDEAARMGQKVGNVMSAVGALSNLAGLCMMRGQLHKAAQIYQRALEWATDEQGQLLPVAGKVLMGLGELWREWNDLEAATRYLTQGIELTRQYGEIGTIIAYLSLARIKQAQGDANGADDVMYKAQEIALAFDAADMDDTLVSALQARLWIEQGYLQAAMRWVEERGLEKDAVPSASGEDGVAPAFSLRELEHVTLARLYLAQERPDEALQTLKPLLPPMEKMGWMRRILEILLLQALALQMQGDVERALTVLEQALSLAEPEGFVRVFLDEGEPIARLLYQAAARGIAPECAGRLLAAFGKDERPRMKDDSIFRPAKKSLIEPLSERELEVLRLIAEGLSNREIAGRLFISLSTVKGHTSNIYGKLAVSSRTLAVATARALGLLPE